MISVLILTRNEQDDLPDCLSSVSWSDDIHVFDSHSTDHTVAIASAAGVHIHTRTFDDYATHRNAALTSVPFKHQWVFLLDADERPTPQLSHEMQQIALTASAQISAFRIRRRDFLFNTWLKHAQISPLYIRLVRPERVHYTRPINEILEVNGPIADLNHPLDHYPFSKGIARWIEKHNLYSTIEAQLVFRNQGLQNPSLAVALRDPDFHTRRIHQKAIFYRLPGRPLLKWLYMVFLRRAILDGPAGLTYATLQAFYEYLIVLKTKELRLSHANLTHQECELERSVPRSSRQNQMSSTSHTPLEG